MAKAQGRSDAVRPPFERVGRAGQVFALPRSSPTLAPTKRAVGLLTVGRLLLWEPLGIRSVDVSIKMMSAPPSFLGIDYHPESRFLLVKTLLRKFPGAVIQESDCPEAASEIAGRGEVAAIITHRTIDLTGIELVRRLREADAVVPIVMVSGIDRERGALEAGATSFLCYDEWLRIGTVVEGHLNQRAQQRAMAPANPLR